MATITSHQPHPATAAPVLASAQDVAFKDRLFAYKTMSIKTPTNATTVTSDTTVKEPTMAAIVEESDEESSELETKANKWPPQVALANKA